MLNLRLVVSFIKFKLHYTVQPAHKERTFGESRYVIALGTLVPIVFFIAYILFHIFLYLYYLWFYGKLS